MGMIDRHINSIKGLCGKHKVEKLFVFGSVLTSNFSDESDIDFVVDFSVVDLKNYADNYFSLKYALEELLGRDVDLLEEQAIRNPYLRKSIDENKRLIYG